MVKFRHGSKEEICGEVVSGCLSRKYAKYGGIACLRTKGHRGRHMGRMDLAAKADGVCAWCRQPLTMSHELTCDKPKGAK